MNSLFLRLAQWSILPEKAFLFNQSFGGSFVKLIIVNAIFVNYI